MVNRSVRQGCVAQFVSIFTSVGGDRASPRLQRSGNKESPKPQLQPLTFDPALWHSRMKVAEAFDTYLRGCGVAENSRIPRNSTIRFVRTKLVLKKNMKESQVCRWIRRWHPQWKESGKRPAAVAVYSKKEVLWNRTSSETAAWPWWWTTRGVWLGA